MPKNDQKRGIKKRIGCCEACGIAIPCVLHLHHFYSSNARGSERSNKGGYVCLCANCHNMLHYEIGWNDTFSGKYDRDATLAIIKGVREKYGEASQYVMGF